MAWVLETRPELLDAAIAQRPFLLSISFGSFAAYEKRVHDAGIRLAAQVNTRRAAIAAVEQGADLVVAQGTEAGGHTGSVSTLPLLQIVLEAIDKPVAAAGGIASPAGLAAILAAGAAAGWIGTAFLLSEEADVMPGARSRIAEAEETGTILTSVFDRVNELAWPPEHPGRALRNGFAERWHGRETDLVLDTDEMARFRRGAKERDFDITSIWAGEAVGLLRQSRSAADVVEGLGAGAERILRERLNSICG
jgi:nitronate monooxygenase